MERTKIDWCDSTWNPVTGCLHVCEYCYARGIANRFKEREGHEINEENVNFIFHFDGTPPFYELNEPCYYNKTEDLESIETDIKAPYPYGFKPTFHRYRLNDYIGKKGRNIFVCSMADLFGEWVPDSWIEEVFNACEKAPQHNYLFLTKNPKRYEELLDRYMPDNMWFGWSQTEPMGGKLTFSTHHSVRTFVSIEPLLKPFEDFLVTGMEWVIIGAETGRRKDKVVPEKKWIEDIVNACKELSVPVFMKSSLSDIWGEPLIQEFPKELRKDV